MLRMVGCGLLALVGLIAIVLVGGYFVLKRPDIPYATLEQEYASPASQYVELPGGIRMHYRDEGQDEGAPTLLLVHGFSASLHTWEPWVRELSEQYRVISLDLPGHGLTRAPAGYQANIEAYRDVVHAFTQARGLSRFAIAGSSMGGNVAWEYALAHPEQIEALILVGASGWPDTRAEAAEEPATFRLLRNPILAPVLRDLDNRRLIREGLEAGFYNATLVDDTMVNRYVELSRAPGHREILIQITLGFRSRNFATPERLAPLTQIPTLIVTGDTDRLVPPAHAQQFADAIPGSEIIVYERIGHLPQEETAEASAMAVHEFLYRIHEGPALAPVE